MHIPDSAISPATSLAAGAAMLPVWYGAGRRLSGSLSTRQVPLLAVGSAFSFTVMLLNIPVPGGTTVHPVGAVLLAVLLGPWAAILGVTVALAIQALFFGDGGLLALGANCFTMALAMPVCGYLVYRILAGRAPRDSSRRAVAAGAAAWVGINAAALLTAVILGIQPALWHDAQGHALYFVWGLKVTLPAMAIPHALIGGPAEAVVTALAVRYLQAAGLPLFGADGKGGSPGRQRTELAWLGLAVLLALSPLGLLARGEAWGEWDAHETSRRAGYLPVGTARAEAHAWTATQVLPDYLSGRGPTFYVLAGTAGAAVIAVACLLLGLGLARRGRGGARSAVRQAQVPEHGGLPVWLAASGEPAAAGPGVPPARRGGAWRLAVPQSGGGYLDRTLAETAGAARETLVAERWARQEGLLQSLDPRAKLLALVGFVVLAACVHRPAVLAGLYGVSLALGLFSHVPAGVLLRRVWLAVPLFVGAMTLPAALSVVTPGPALLVLHARPYLAITAPGLAVAGLLTLRVGVAVSFAMLLTLTTRWDSLLAALRVLLVPRPFIVVLAMTYRYLAVMMQAAAEMFVARRSRTVGRTSSAGSRRFLAAAMGSLFGRTLALTDQVHAAMLSRGWTGEPRPARAMRLRFADAAWLGAMCMVAAIAIVWERIL